MAGFLREHSLPIAFSVLLHGLLVAALLLTTLVSFKRVPPIVQPLPIDAVVIDSQVLRAAQKVQSDRVAQDAARLKAAAEAKTAADAKAAIDAQAIIDAKNAEQQRADDVKHAAAAAELEVKRQSDIKHAEQVKQTENAARAEVAKRAEDAKRADEAKRAEETKRTEAAKHAEETERAAAQKEKSEREAELKRQLADEEHASAVQSGPLRDQYMARLQSRIQSAWIRPPSALVGLDCLVEVTQIPGGVVTAARVTQCNGDAAARQSIENAVYRASPLPSPGDPALFSRLFTFHFHPDQ